MAFLVVITNIPAVIARTGNIIFKIPIGRNNATNKKKTKNRNTN